MVKRIFFFLILAAAIAACSDNDSFTTSQSARLTFATDSVKMDTIFSTVPSRTYDLWVYNRSNDGLRLNTVRLRHGNQTGFRVNVDGSYLDNTLGSVINDLEVRKGDSIRVFVELTAPENMQDEPQMIEDELVFTLESGVEQVIHLRGWAWDAVVMRDVIVSSDSVITGSKPIIVYGGLRVDSAATLTVSHATLYFHDQAGIDVYGTLKTDSAVFRGDRLDHMFDYLPYDRVSGQWRGIRLHPSSTGNHLVRSEIRNAETGICCDSAAFTPDTPRLTMEYSIIHNSKGAGIEACNAFVRLNHCQLTNAQDDCLAIYGGQAYVDDCTIGQFYPFAGGRGAALRFTNSHGDYPCGLHGFRMTNSIVTGYDKDVVMGERLEGDSVTLFSYAFLNNLLRTPKVEDDTISFRDIIWETPDDSIQGKQHFRLIDEDNLIYDFHLDSLSTAKGLGCYKME